MPRFAAFPAVRYDTTANPLDRVTAPPYDVLSDAEVVQLADQHPHNIVRIDVPLEREGPGRYEAAARRLDDWLASGALVTDSSPTFTIYRMHFVDDAGVARSTAGVLGALEVVDEGAGGVLPHERTTPKAASDRLELTRATRANLSPVWGLSLAEGLTRLFDEPGELVGEVTVDGVTHRVERVSDPARIDAITAAVSAAPVLIADGHHRYAVSRTYRDEVRTATGSRATEAELTLAYVGELVADQLSVAAIHRLYRGVDPAELRAALAQRFELHDTEPLSPDVTRTMEARGALVLVNEDGTGTWLQPRPGAFAEVRDLDGARLEATLADVPHEVTYQHGVQHVIDRVTSGDAVAGVLIRPVSVAEIRRTADEGLLMPPKSTFFTPKLRTGLLVRRMRLSD